MFVTDKVRPELDRLVTLFGSKTFNSTVTAALIKFPDKPSSRWSICNRLIMLCHGTTDARGFHQWQEVGRRVKAGSHAFYILAPVFKKVKEEELREDGAIEEVETVYLLGFTGISVFRQEDTYGKPLPEYKPQNPRPLDEAATALGISVTYENVPGAYGATTIDGKRIALATENVKVWFHELAHAAHSRLEEGLKGGQDPEQETIAELSACALASIYGYANHNEIAETWNYISHYAKSKDPIAVARLCMKVLSKVEKVVNSIITASNAQIDVIAQ